MRIRSFFAACAALVIGCSSASDNGGESANAPDPVVAGGAPGAAGGGATKDTPAGQGGGDPYAEIFAAVDKSRLEKLLKEMTGYAPVTIDGKTVNIAERYTPASKALWRAYWKQYYESLGATVRETTFPVKNLVGETVGHNVEAVFAGKSKDSVVAIVHYDSTGAAGKETQNPAVDDNMTPMAIQMEAARLLSQRRDRLERTVRFVATDYEEITTIEGGKAYVADLEAQAKAEGFAIVAAIDGELSGWNCFADKKCTTQGALTVVTGSCDGQYTYPTFGTQMTDLASRYSKMKVVVECDSDTNGSELYNFWKAGVPAFYFEELDNDDNDHFDENAGDTLDRIDMDYFFSIGQVAAVFIANVVGVK
jgi:hypothetical protein